MSSCSGHSLQLAHSFINLPIDYSTHLPVFMLKLCAPLIIIDIIKEECNGGLDLRGRGCDKVYFKEGCIFDVKLMVLKN